MVPTAGVDGCKKGWVVVTDDRAFVCPTLEDVLGQLSDKTIVAVDIPIGLPDVHDRGGRECDRLARQRLAGGGSVVFPTPARPVLDHLGDFDAARKAVGKLNVYMFGLAHRIDDVDRVVRRIGQDRIFEVHPELSFLELNQGRALASKKTLVGLVGRRELLSAATIPLHPTPRGSSDDDLFDASAALWSARRIANGEAFRMPDTPPVDACGLRMEIWC